MDARFDESQHPVFMTRIHGLYAIIMERFSGRGIGDWSKWRDLHGAGRAP